MAAGRRESQQYIIETNKFTKRREKKGKKGDAGRKEGGKDRGKE